MLAKGLFAYLSIFADSAVCENATDENERKTPLKIKKIRFDFIVKRYITVIFSGQK